MKSSAHKAACIAARCQEIFHHFSLCIVILTCEMAPKNAPKLNAKCAITRMLNSSVPAISENRLDDLYPRIAQHPSDTTYTIIRMPTPVTAML